MYPRTKARIWDILELAVTQTFIGMRPTAFINSPYQKKGRVGRTSSFLGHVFIHFEVGAAGLGVFCLAVILLRLLFYNTLGQLVGRTPYIYAHFGTCNQISPDVNYIDFCMNNIKFRNGEYGI